MGDRAVFQKRVVWWHTDQGALLEGIFRVPCHLPGLAAGWKPGRLLGGLQLHSAPKLNRRRRLDLVLVFEHGPAASTEVEETCQKGSEINDCSGSFVLEFPPAAGFLSSTRNPVFGSHLGFTTVSLAARCQCCACRGTGSDVIAGSARIAAHHRGSIVHNNAGMARLAGLGFVFHFMRQSSHLGHSHLTFRTVHHMDI
jgi:hypothetical protein